MRKVCVEHMSGIIKHLDVVETEKFQECFDFFKRCINDSNRWVKNQALIQFGPIVHNIFLKIDDKQPKAYVSKLKDLVNEMCLSYYDVKMIFPADSDLDESLANKLDEYSFMQNKNDDIDKIKYYWAYNLPCALLVNGGQRYWMDHMKNIYELLYKDILLNVRTTMAAGFKEVINLVEIEKMENPEDQQYFIAIINHYLKDSEEVVSQKVLPTMCTLVSKFPEEKKLELLDSLIK